MVESRIVANPPAASSTPVVPATWLPEASIFTLSSSAATKLEVVPILTPTVQLVMFVSLMVTFLGPPVSSTLIPLPTVPVPVNPEMTQFSTISALPEMNRMPLPAVVVAPLMDRCRNVTTAELGATDNESLMMTPLVPEARMEPNPAPFVPSMVMLFVVVTAPKPPGSRVLISPFVAVFEMAPAYVLQGAVRLQGFTSSPTPDTQVRVACAWATEATVRVKMARANIFNVKRNL